MLPERRRANCHDADLLGWMLALLNNLLLASVSSCVTCRHMVRVRVHALAHVSDVGCVLFFGLRHGNRCFVDAALA